MKKILILLFLPVLGTRYDNSKKDPVMRAIDYTIESYFNPVRGDYSKPYVPGSLNYSEFISK